MIAAKETPKRSLRIVVAEDERDMREYLQEMLPRFGHEVIGAATNGRELTGLCSKLKPDLVISDVRMPDLDGVEAAKQINEERPTPIILISAYHEQPLLQRALQQYVLAYLVKPIKQVDLEVAISLASKRSEEFQALRKETADLRQSLEERKLIERAKGIVIKRLGIAEDDAFRRLRKHASDHNQKLVEVANQVLAAESVFLALGG